MVCTKTIIHLSVGESGGYLPSLRWIIVNYLADFCRHVIRSVGDFLHYFDGRGDKKLTYSSRQFDELVSRESNCWPIFPVILIDAWADSRPVGRFFPPFWRASRQCSCYYNFPAILKGSGAVTIFSPPIWQTSRQWIFYCNFPALPWTFDLREVHSIASRM